MGKKNDKNEKGSLFMGFILLKDPILDIEQAKKDIIADWDITISKEESDEDKLIFYTDEMMVTITLMPGPIPHEEIEGAASTNYMWKDAVEITKTQKAHILVAIFDFDKKKSQLEKGKLYVKICSSVLKQKSVIGIYTSGTVFEPSYYIAAAGVMKDDQIPIANWIYIGLYGSEKGMCGYTYGMRSFDKDELEIIDSSQDAAAIHSFLTNIADYILENDVTLKDGETIGFTEDQKLSITRSKAIALPPDTKTFKIAF